MPVQKQAISVNFAQGLDTKTDPWQVSLGKFLALDNSIFDKGGLLQKRNGYQTLPSLPTTDYSYLTTLNDNLTALGPSIAAFSAGSAAWVSKGSITPMKVSTLPLIRNNLNQVQSDAAITSTGLICTVYTETTGSVTSYKYAIADSITGQNIVQPTVIAATASGSPRVFILGGYFVIVFTNTITAVTHLQYVSIPINFPSSAPTTPADIASTYAASPGLSWDGQAFGDNLYVTWATTAPSMRIGYLPLSSVASGTALTTSVSFATAATPTLASLTIDTTTTNPVIYVSYYMSSTTTAQIISVFANSILSTNFTARTLSTSGTILNIAQAAQSSLDNVYLEYDNIDSGTGVHTHFITDTTVTSSGTVGSPFTLIRSLGLGSKAFILNGTIYFLGAYQSTFQSTYFLINASLSTQASPVVVSKIAYENGGGYLTLGLPNVTLNNTTSSIPYLNKDLIQSLTNANESGTSVIGGIYSQTGVNLVNFDFTTDGTDSAEIGASLEFGGGFLWMYDGYLPVELNFFTFPDAVTVTGSTTGGTMTAQQYFYEAVYEWSDNQGNIHRSAGSIPVSATTTGSTSSVVVNVSTLRLTYKTANPVKVTIYRFSTGLQTFHEITSISSPLLNSTTVDSVSFTDTLPDSAISGNAILYTTGGVIEDTSAPATNLITLFDDRLWLVDAEDPNLLWFSKQVIESTPVEMSDLLTVYVAPTTGAQGSTGNITAISPMDDKLIIFKDNAIYYMNGTGPDNTGSNNQYSQPIFITSTVGCSNQQSIVFMPSGLMFQSDKGIWLLGRDLNTKYIGAAVEKYNSSRVQSAVNVPATNQVRFTLSTGQTLMYDYFYEQWGTFSGVSAVSSCIYQGLHTFINKFGATYQESPGIFRDGPEPVNMSFTTSWLNLAGVQGYQRSFFFFLLANYLTPHKLQLGIAYDYNPSITQVSTISPDNYSTPFGSGSSQDPFGQGTPFGGPGTVENWRIFLARQRCQSFQITLQEAFDPTFGTEAGAGLTITGLNLVVGIKRGYRTIGQARSVGGGTNRG